MRRRDFIAGGLACAAARAEESGNAVWTLENDRIVVTYGWSAEGWFRLLRLENKAVGRPWQASSTAPGAVARVGGAGGLNIDAHTVYAQPVVEQVELENGGRRLVFTLQPKAIAAEIRLEAEVYPGHPFVRQRWRYRNLGPRVVITSAAFLDVNLDAENRTFRAFRVNQWVDGGKGGNFETQQTDLARAGRPWVVESGSFAQHCAWAAVRGPRNNSLAVGWEFNGRAQMWLEQKPGAGLLSLTGFVTDLNQPVARGEAFEAPAVFLGAFQGDWDEAGYQTQRFVDSVLAAPMPDRQKFPYAAWDSWGYEDRINETVLRRAADVAQRLGIELFQVDLGWAVRLGDWRGDPVKFPSGMRALSDYVHAHGMQFGLHLPLLEADPASDVLRQNPDWTSSVSDGFYGAVSLCPSHEPAKQWMIQEALRLIREYNVDWILLDGVNLVKVCTKRTHTHNPQNSNYANAVNGIDQIVAAIRREAPQVAFENCQSGGRMMTYQMVRECATSITADDSSALITRQAVYGATYPFPPRYTDRYLGENLVTPYNLRSAMFGGPWMLMQKITEWSEGDIAVATREVGLYKSLRGLIRDAKVFHLTPRPDGMRNEAIQAHNYRQNRSVIFLFRHLSNEDSMTVMPRGLSPRTEYQVRLQEAGAVQVALGRDLLDRGIEVPLPAQDFAEIVHLTPLAESSDE